MRDEAFICLILPPTTEHTFQLHNEKGGRKRGEKIPHTKKLDRCDKLNATIGGR